LGFGLGLSGLRVEHRLGALVLLRAALGVPLGHRGLPPSGQEAPQGGPGAAEEQALCAGEQREQRAPAAAVAGLLLLAHGRLELGRVEARAAPRLLLEVRAPPVEQREPGEAWGQG